MANADCSTTDLIEFVNSNPISGKFVPYAYYGEEEDALVVYFKGEPSYARRLNSRVTIFIGQDTDKLVGCQIKSVRYVLEDLGWFPVKIEHRNDRLRMLFVALRGEFGDEPENRRMYREIGEQISNANLEAALP